MIEEEKQEQPQTEPRPPEETAQPSPEETPQPAAEKAAQTAGEEAPQASTGEDARPAHEETEQAAPERPLEGEAQPADGRAAEPVEEELNVLEKKQEDNVMAVIESLLFAYDKPLTVDQIRKVLDNLEAGQVRKAAARLMEEYETGNRGMRIVEVAGGYKMISAPHFASFLRKLFKGPQSNEKLSGPSLETLAIIAYKQPLSKLEVESLRQVNVDGVIATLLEKNLIRVTGRKEAPGRPKVYGTTREFLEYFGLKSLDDLPKLEHFPLNPEKQREILERFTQKQNEAGEGTPAPEEAKENDNPQQPA